MCPRDNNKNIICSFLNNIIGECGCEAGGKRAVPSLFTFSSLCSYHPFMVKQNYPLKHFEFLNAYIFLLLPSIGKFRKQRIWNATE